MTEFTPEIKQKLLQRAQKNAKWVKKLEDVCASLDPSDPKSEKVQRLQQILKIQALLIVKKLKELGNDGGDESPGMTNAKPDVTPIRRNPMGASTGPSGGEMV